ncbi:FadR/GntR family transcriptional regulator [Maritimibacter dapengensis]|uniref:FCD domain-containing protein n=1 Tax=Maritimibacter dapengensis TaxID=2836868 RepID=A0ABS6T5V4_9RHOB|nr:FCD domain-containing protein [Maritimibacter dapengensis]MBV7379906.1 FCD domain-containing protein [Maritimibacter dapengensis]
MDGIDDLSRLRAFIEGEAERGNNQLPPEPKLAEALDVSRGRLRTLLKRVEDEGLIWRHVGKGTFIGEREIDPTAPEWAADVSLGDIMDARRLLEPMLAGQAAINARPADLSAMEKCLTEMETAASYAQWKRLDERLHRLIATATRNPLLLLLHDTLRGQGRSGLDTRLNAVFGQETAPSATNRQHEAIVAAIRNGDPESAENAMREHLTSVREQLFGLR